MRGQQQTSSVGPAAAAAAAATVGRQQQEAHRGASDKGAPTEPRCAGDTRASTSNILQPAREQARPMSPWARHSIRPQRQQARQQRQQRQQPPPQLQQQLQQQQQQQRRQQQHKRRRQRSCGGAFWPAASLKQPLFLAAFLLLLAPGAFRASRADEQQQQPAASKQAQEQLQLSFGAANQAPLDQQAAGERARRSASRLRAESELAECARLSALWAAFRASYPRLARHLLAEEPRQQVRRQDAKAVARLLEGAERLLRASESNQLQQQARGSWLARVLANPLYAKIIQHFQDNSNSNNNNNNNNNDNKQRADDKAPGAWSAASRGRSEQDERFYGRVAKYPHELSSSAHGANQEAGGSAAKTLDKLRLLSQHQRQLLGEDENEVRTNKVSKKVDDAARMSNKLLDGGADGDATVERHQEARAANSADKELDSARHKYVYGSVLYRPSENAIDESSERHSSLDALRQLAASSGSLRRARNADANGQLLGQRSAPNEKRSNAAGGQEQAELKDNELLEVKLSVLNWLLHQNWAEQTGAKGWELPTEPAERELLAQLGVPLEPAANEARGAPRPNNDDEFPGVWHSAPAERVAVSYERASKVAGRPVVITLTTARPGDQFVVE